MPRGCIPDGAVAKERLKFLYTQLGMRFLLWRDLPQAIFILRTCPRSPSYHGQRTLFVARNRCALGFGLCVVQVRLEKGWRNFYSFPTDLSCGIRRISIVGTAFSYPSSKVERKCRSAQSASVGQDKKGRNAMYAVKGTFQNGVAHPAEPITGRNGQVVLITFLEEDHLSTQPTKNATGWDALHQLIEDCVVETGMNDLAHQHDHYL